jgi:hypothetical protein
VWRWRWVPASSLNATFNKLPAVVSVCLHMLQGVMLAPGPSKQPLPASNFPATYLRAACCCAALLQGVALALGPSKQPLPAYRAGAYHAAAAQTSAGRYGDIGTHTGLIHQMSPVSAS